MIIKDQPNVCEPQEMECLHLHQPTPASQLYGQYEQANLQEQLCCLQVLVFIARKVTNLHNTTS